MTRPDDAPPYRQSEDGKLEIRSPDGTWFKVDQDEDGGLRLSDKDGRSISMSDEGVSVDIKTVKRIEIADLLRVRKHTITQDGNRVMHHVVFCDGEELEVTYSIVSENLGKFENFELTGGVRCRLSPDGVVTVGLSK